MSIKFQEVTASALSVNYVGSDWIDQHSSLRFVTNVVNRSEAFEIVLARHGHSYSFESSQSSQSQMKCGTDDAELEELSIRYSSTSIQEPIPEPPRSPSPRSEQSRDGIDVRNLDESTGLEELTINIEQLPKVSNTNILGWLTQAYKSSRGFELGTFDSSLLAMTMKTQSSKWDAIALGYVSDIINMAHGFISQLLDLVCPDQRVRDELMSTLTEGLFARYGKAISHARFLLYVERNGTPSTLNHYFNDNLEKW